MLLDKLLSVVAVEEEVVLETARSFDEGCSNSLAFEEKRRDSACVIAVSSSLISWFSRAINGEFFECYRD